MPVLEHTLDNLVPHAHNVDPERLLLRQSRRVRQGSFRRRILLPRPCLRLTRWYPRRRRPILLNPDDLLASLVVRELDRSTHDQSQMLLNLARDALPLRILLAIIRAADVARDERVDEGLQLVAEEGRGAVGEKGEREDKVVEDESEEG